MESPTASCIEESCENKGAKDEKDINQNPEKKDESNVSIQAVFDPNDLIYDKEDVKDDDTNVSQSEDQEAGLHDSLLTNELSISGSGSTPSDGNTPRDDDTSSGSPSPIPDDSAEGLEASSRPKVRLGKDISLMMQALNSLQSPEEKIAALCKKFADLLQEHKLGQKQLRGAQRKQGQYNKEREQMQTDLNKALLAKSKMESLARELNKQNKLLKQESYNKALAREKERELSTVKFQAATVEITNKIDSVAKQNSLLEEENKRLVEKISHHAKENSSLEKTVKALLEHRHLNEQLLAAKFEKAEAQKEEIIAEKQKYMEEYAKCIEHEKEMKSQIQYYSEKFEDFQSTLEKSNKLFATFRTEIDRLTKKVKELEKDNILWLGKCEESDTTLKLVLHEKSKQGDKISRLTSLCRAQQAERNSLAKKISELEKSKKNPPPEVKPESVKQLPAKISKPDIIDETKSEPPKSSIVQPTECKQEELSDSNGEEQKNSVDISSTEPHKDVSDVVNEPEETKE